MPDITQQLEAQVLAAKESKTKLNIVGGNSKHFLGREPKGEPLNMSEHSGIVDYQPVELC